MTLPFLPVVRSQIHLVAFHNTNPRLLETAVLRMGETQHRAGPVAASLTSLVLLELDAY